jgi:anti-sigma factor RsiW
MASHLESKENAEDRGSRPRSVQWLKLGALAAASALAGGLAAAWWHRKTLAKLRESPENDANPNFRIPESGTQDEV